ncbi:MAG: hypothetical protein ABIK47_02475 [candidate division WOR-3 bacterium]
MWSNQTECSGGSKSKNTLTAIVMFFVVFLLHSVSLNATSDDSRWSIHTAMSIIKEGNTDLDEYRPLVLKEPSYLYEFVDGHIYFRYPIGASILAIPFVYILDKVFPLLFQTFPPLEALVKRLMSQPPSQLTVITAHQLAEVIIASLFVAITALFIYSLALFHLKRNGALAIALLFAFATPAWSTASRALWQHTPSILLLTIALFLVIKAKTKPALVQFLSLPLGFSFICRPTNAIAIIAFSIYVFLYYRRYFLLYLFWGLAILVPFVLYNLHIYHLPLSPYYLQSATSTTHLLEGLLGTLFSPSRGVFVFSPVLLFSIYGMVEKLRHQKEEIDIVLIIIILLHWIVISAFPNWYGGHTLGPRYFTDVIPYFIYFLIPVFKKLPTLNHFKRTVLTSLFIFSATISFLIHLNCAMNRATERWNAEPVDVDKNPARVWDWYDPQFLRGIIRK